MFLYARIIDTSCHSEIQFLGHLFLSLPRIYHNKFLSWDCFCYIAYTLLCLHRYTCFIFLFLSVIYRWFGSMLLNFSFWVYKTFPGVSVWTMSWPLNGSHFLICRPQDSWKIIVLDFFCCCAELPKALHSLTPESRALAELLVVSLCVVDKTVGAQGRTSKCHCILNHDQREETKGLLHRITGGLPTGTYLWKASSPPIVHLGTP